MLCVTEMGPRFRPQGLRFRPAGLRFRPAGLRFRPVGLHFRPVGLRSRPVGLRFRPVGLRFRPQSLRSCGLRFRVFVLDTSTYQYFKNEHNASCTFHGSRNDLIDKASCL